MFLTDENFQSLFINGLRSRVPDVDLKRAVDVGLNRTPDADILEWAANERRVFLTHDVATMLTTFADRLAAGKWSAGVLEVDNRSVIAPVIEDLAVIAVAGEAADFENRVQFLPL